jgi:hypothetical protein
LQLPWKAIHWEEKKVIVSVELAKTKRRRIIPLFDNAIAWLKAYLTKKGMVDAIPTGRIIRLSDNELQSLRSYVFSKVAGTDANGPKQDFAKSIRPLA